MKSPILLSALLLSPVCLAQDVITPKELPAFPVDCSEQIEVNGIYCSNISIVGSTIDVTFVGIASKETFPNAEDLQARYLDFAAWPSYVASSPQNVVTYKKGGSIALPVTTGLNGVTTYGQFFDYDLAVQGIPLLKQNVRGVTYNYIVAPYAMAINSVEFEAQPGPVPGYPDKLKGLKSQTGSVHVMECTGLTVCDDTKWLVEFHTTVQPDISIAMTIVGKTIKAGIEDILNGILEQQ